MNDEEKVVATILALLIAMGLSLLVNLAVTPLMNWVIHFFRPDVTLTYWEAYGVSFIIGLLTGGNRVPSKK